MISLQQKGKYKPKKILQIRMFFSFPSLYITIKTYNLQSERSRGN